MALALCRNVNAVVLCESRLSKMNPQEPENPFSPTEQTVNPTEIVEQTVNPTEN